ncbi:helix-turn-helix transcriptional regulator [Nocardia caishijiensis]|uniref:Helix-turn-helix protein n=1 Tax=Nocardia caishijiensis TaxID=184756 RepID=A0ABQ6YE81_9NOCA|nr:helix-turn-helix domain-containing protein [Nocardia caishijiensis]KAF0835719.1 helix-turn-helix protein [Nocardia caishijiensis]
MFGKRVFDGGKDLDDRTIDVVQATRPDAVASLNENDWYTTEEVAAVLKVDASSLRRWRTASPPQGPPFVHLTSRVTRYLGADVLAYVRRNRIDPAAA